jgi:hypothetical protein
MVNYFRDMRPQSSHLLAPLSSLTSAKAKWNWTTECQNTFEDMKGLIYNSKGDLAYLCKLQEKTI